MSGVYVVHLDPLGGIAGDMFAAAMLAACPELTDRVLSDCAAVLPDGVTAELANAKVGALAAHRFAMVGTAERNTATTYQAMIARIEGARLCEGTSRHAGEILRRLAEAEAAVHGVALDGVHFHEIADWDSLMDVVAAGSIAAALEGARWTVGPIPLGSGTVSTQHGILPVPAPATALLLRGFDCADDGVPGERVTPTGAAIIAHLATSGPSGGRLVATGLGAGTRTLAGVPNVLRALVFCAVERCDAPVAVLTFDIDDMSGEEIAVAADHLRAHEGVIDVSLASRQGKKGRPATEVRVLAEPDRLDPVALACLDETTTLGLRWHVEARMTLPREATHVATEAGLLRAKRATRPDGRLTTKVESDELAPVAGVRRRRALAHTT